MKKVNIQQALNNAIEETVDSNEKYMASMYKWACYIEKQIGSYYGYKLKALAKQITGVYYQLPEDCYRPIAVIPGNYEQQYNARFFGASEGIVTVETRDDDVELVWTPMNSSKLNEVFWAESGERLVLAEEFSNYILTLIYQYIETDPQGFWLVNESHIKAITDYLIYKLESKLLARKSKSQKMLRSGDVEYVRMLQNEYENSVRDARVQDAENNEKIERRQL